MSLSVHDENVHLNFSTLFDDTDILVISNAAFLNWINW